MNVIDRIRAAFHDYLTTNYKQDTRSIAGLEINLNSDPAKAAFGDLSTNAALMLAKLCKRSPKELCDEIAAGFKHSLVASCQAAGPGFMNLTLTQEAFIQLMQELVQQKDTFFKLDPEQQQLRYNIEFVSANPTGPLHLGHGRGGIIGDVLGNIERFIGHEVAKEFYINDAGNQIQHLGHSFKARCLQQLGQDISIPQDGYHGEYLVALAQEVVKQYGESLLTQPDTFFAEYAKDYLLEQIKRTLQQYGITYDVWFSEKQLHTSGAVDRALAELQKTGYLYEHEGALWFASTKFGDDKDRVVRKQTGETTYVAADIAYIQDKLARGFNRLIYVLGQDHHSYAVRLKGIMSALGHNPDHLHVILYQLVTLKETGQLVRMSKRSGRLVTLQDIIDTVGKDVARFFYLNKKADAHLEFDLDLALKHTQENPVYYLQYAYVRLHSILEKAAQYPEFANISFEDAQAITEHERLLLKKITALKDLLLHISTTYHTHLLTYYLLELAALFHKYYNDHRVIDPAAAAQSRARLLLVKLLHTIYAMTFSIIGISQPEKM